MDARWNVESLRYARAVAEAGSLSAAARACGVSQPALSNSVAKLEGRLGQRLFDRSTSGVAPTSFGRRMLPLIEQAISGLDAIAAEANRSSGLGAGTIRMGVSPLIGAELVTRVFRAVRELPVPRDLVLREADMEDLRDRLTTGDLDVILIPSVLPMPQFEHRVVAAEPLVAVRAAPAPAETATLADLAEDSMILVPDTCGLTRLTTLMFREQGIPLRTYPGEATGYRVLGEWAAMGLGTAILPISRVGDAGPAARVLVEDDHELEIFYEAVWSASAASAEDIGRTVELLAATGA